MCVPEADTILPVLASVGKAGGVFCSEGKNGTRLPGRRESGSAGNACAYSQGRTSLASCSSRPMSRLAMSLEVSSAAVYWFR